MAEPRKLNRRTFLKAVFAAAVAPASVVKVLYSTPSKGDIIILDEFATKWPTYHKECQETIHYLENLMREAITVTTWQPSKEKMFFKGVELEFKPNLGERDDETYIADPPKTSAYCAKPNVRDLFYDMFKFGIMKTKRIGIDIEGNTWDGGNMIRKTDWPQPPERRS